MYNFQTAGTNNHYIDPSNVVVSTKTRDDGNYVFKENQLAEEYQLNLFVTYDRKFGNHDLSALFVYEQSEGDSEKFDAQRNKLITWEMPEFFGASGDASESIVGAGSVSESGRLSYVGRLNYAYADKYLLEAAFRVMVLQNLLLINAGVSSPLFQQDGVFPVNLSSQKISSLSIT